jgi:hypothetical protein
LSKVKSPFLCSTRVTVGHERSPPPIVGVTPASSPGWFDDEPAMLAGARCL